MKLKDWIRDARGKRPAEETYVDFAAVPPEPEGPYRARMAVATHERAPAGIDVNEREIVAGELQLLYRTRCPCGHYWDAVHFERMSICPNCARAVLVDAPTVPPG